MGNPPFVGYGLQTGEQKADMLSVYVDEAGKPCRAAGKIDYVAWWYFKAAAFMQGSPIRAAFVSTNSITQGDQVAVVWRPLFERFGAQIDFAHRTFRWDSESAEKAAVHCVIIGFSCGGAGRKKYIYADGRATEASNISPYIADAPTVFIEKRSRLLCDAPPMTTGNRPADGGHLIIEAEDYEAFIKKEPAAKKWIKRLAGSDEYINGKARYCLWLVGASPKELRGMPQVMERLEKCREDRLNGAADRQKLAETPALFRETKNPSQYLIVPRVSSENRRYIPIGFLDGDTIPTDSATIIENATLYHFGVLTLSELSSKN